MVPTDPVTNAERPVVCSGGDQTSSTSKEEGAHASLVKPYKLQFQTLSIKSCHACSIYHA